MINIKTMKERNLLGSSYVLAKKEEIVRLKTEVAKDGKAFINSDVHSLFLIRPEQTLMMKLTIQRAIILLFIFCGCL